ncbi:MAG: MBL fold metallo-hydrolase [Candidatus Babeliaceae bacterium]|jgi:L-ascorbate metabolism protein UlaG (beta-lactamase superfamily)
MYPYYKNNRFLNHPDEKGHSVFFKSLWMIITGIFSGRRTQRAHNFLHAPTIAEHNALRNAAGHNKCVITWLGHATFLITVPGATIITDPVLGDLSLLYKRWDNPVITPDQLPSIDIILLSHNHRDHMDEASIRILHAKNPAIKTLVPMGDKAWFIKRGLGNVHECSWWESIKIGEAMYTFLPAKHWSQRGFFDRNKSLWGSWMIQSPDICLYFAGDTAYGEHFSLIGKQYSIDIALMPIGPCEPHAWMKDSHLNAQQAVQAFCDLNARHFIAMHWGTFPFGIDYQALPYEYLLDSWQTHSDKALRKKTLHPGACGKTLQF